VQFFRGDVAIALPEENLGQCQALAGWSQPGRAQFVESVAER